MILKLKFKKTLLLILGYLITSSQISCTKKIIPPKKITVASSGKIESIDPARADNLRSMQLLSSIGDTLYELGKDGKLIPRLASDFPEFSEDNLQIKIKLKDNISFHDGTPFNSEAMKFTIERFQKIGTANYILSSKIKSIETPSEKIIIINLITPLNSIDGLLTSVNLTAISPAFYKNHKDKFLNDKFVGTGKYYLIRFTNQIQTLEPYADYWGQKSKNKGINFVGYANSSSLFNALISKQIDVLLSNSIDDSQRKKLHLLSKNNFLKEGRSNPIELSFITLRTNKYPLNKKNLRVAISKSINRKLISEKVSYGLRQPSKSIVPLIYKNNRYDLWPSYAPQEAMEIFKDEGYCDGKVLDLDLTYRSNVPSDKLFAMFWQQDIANTLSDCISVNIEGIESTTVYKNLSEGAYSSVILDWTGSYSDPEAYLSPLLRCNKIDKKVCKEGESVYSGSFWGSNEVENLFQESNKLTGFKRINKLIQIEEIASKSIPYIPIWFSSQKAWSQNKITKPTFNSAGRILMGDLQIINE